MHTQGGEEETKSREVIFTLEHLVLSNPEVNYHCHLFSSFSAKLGTLHFVWWGYTV